MQTSLFILLWPQALCDVKVHVCTCTHVHVYTFFSVVESEGAVRTSSQEVIGLSMGETQAQDITYCIYKTAITNLCWVDTCN